MRIAVISNTAWYLFNFRLNLMLALQSAGHEVIAVAPLDGYASRLSAAGLKYVPVPISGDGINPLIELLTIIRLFHVFRYQRIDLVLSYTPKGNIYSALAGILSGCNFVPNVSGLGRTFIKQSFITHVVRLLYRFTFHRARHVFFQNYDDQAFFISEGFVAREKAERLPGSGVDLVHFSEAAITVEVDNVTNFPVFLMVARVMWDKGIGEYVEAARKVCLHYPKARFQLLGFADIDNPAAVPRTTLKQWTAEGVIEYLGTTDDVRLHMRNADCIVLPSYREGVPRTLLEAAAMSRPVITTDTTGCRDAVIDGETGFLCKVRDANDLAETMLRFIALSQNERKTMGVQGRYFVEQEFDERIVIDRYLELVRTL